MGRGRYKRKGKAPGSQLSGRTWSKNALSCRLDETVATVCGILMVYTKLKTPSGVMIETHHVKKILLLSAGETEFTMPVSSTHNAVVSMVLFWSNCFEGAFPQKNNIYT